MIVGAHSIIYSADADRDRAFLRDVLGLPSVDVGGGWLIFGLPPAELAVHPGEGNDKHEFYCMTDDLEALLADLRTRGIACSTPAALGWGMLTHVTLPGGGKLGVYQPRHARPPSPPSTNSIEKRAADGPEGEKASRNLEAITPFFIVKDLQASIAYYRERLGFQLDSQGPADDPYYARVSRDGIGIMLKAIVPDVLPSPNHTRHAWARWDAYIYTLDPDALFDEFRQSGVSFVKELSLIDDGLWGFEITDADGYVLAFFQLRNP